MVTSGLAVWTSWVHDWTATCCDVAPEPFSVPVSWGASEEADGVSLGVSGPRLLFCLEGTVRVSTAAHRTRDVTRGTALWLPACDGDVVVAPVGGPAIAFAAADGLEAPDGPDLPVDALV